MGFSSDESGTRIRPALSGLHADVMNELDIREPPRKYDLNMKQLKDACPIETIALVVAI